MSGGISVTGLGEVVLNVASMDRSLAFYRDILGLRVVSPPEMRNPVFLQAGEAGGVPALVVLVQLPEDAPAFTTPRSLHHLALTLTPGSETDAVASLEASGHEVRRGRHPVFGFDTFYVSDPDGNDVELIAPATSGR